jgi:hypothetical protein
VNGRVRGEYVGGGLVGALGAALDAEEREERQRKVQEQEWRTTRAKEEAADALIQRVSEISRVVVEAAFLAAGYHQHHRGEWRKRRGKGSHNG